MLSSGAGGGILTIIFILYMWDFGSSCCSPLPLGMDLFLHRPSSQAWLFSRCITANIYSSSSYKTPQTVQLGILSPQSSRSGSSSFSRTASPTFHTPPQTHTISPRAWPAPLPSSEQPPKATSTQGLISKMHNFHFFF